MIVYNFFVPVFFQAIEIDSDSGGDVVEEGWTLEEEM